MNGDEMAAAGALMHLAAMRMVADNVRRGAEKDGSKVLECPGVDRTAYVKSGTTTRGMVFLTVEDTSTGTALGMKMSPADADRLAEMLASCAGAARADRGALKEDRDMEKGMKDADYRIVEDEGKKEDSIAAAMGKVLFGDPLGDLERKIDRMYFAKVKKHAEEDPARCVATAHHRIATVSPDWREGDGGGEGLPWVVMAVLDTTDCEECISTRLDPVEARRLSRLLAEAADEAERGRGGDL